MGYVFSWQNDELGKTRKIIKNKIGEIIMNWKEEFIILLEAGTFKTNSEIDDYADEHNLPVVDVWRCFAEYRDDYLIKQSIGTPCEGCKYITRIEGFGPCYECCRNKADYYEERK